MNRQISRLMKNPVEAARGAHHPLQTLGKWLRVPIRVFHQPVRYYEPAN